ncbi:MAG TPA: hypothetical protein PKN32_04735 [Bacteroidales bacterium]|nr:hypothetical protein [Bacteroidales bacterium]
MKVTKLKILLLSFCVLMVAGIVSFILYFSNVRICEEICIYNVNSKTYEIYSASPSGGRIDFVKNNAEKSYKIRNRYVKDIFIITDQPEKFSAVLIIGGHNEKICFSSIVQVENNKYKIKKEIYPKVGFFKKISYSKSNQTFKLLGFQIRKLIKPILYVVLSGFILFLFISFFKYIKRNYKNIIVRIKSAICNIWNIILNGKISIVVIGFVSLLIPLVFYLFSKDVSEYLNISVITFVVVFALLLFPFVLLAYFSKKLKLNTFFWWSFLIIFILSLFVFKSSIYLYGEGFRDDISKFFVKAYNNNVLDCLFTPDSGYLNVFQNLVSIIILKVLGFRQYFPEALQISVAILFSAIFASFNLKSFKIYISDDRYRFVLSILFAVSPFIFSSANFLFEIPFAIATIMFLLLFQFLKKQEVNRTKLLLVLLLFVLFTLSKPIFVIFIPFILIIIIYQLIYNRDKKTGFVFLGILILILLQFYLTVTYSQELNRNNFSGLGTKYESAFSYDNIDLIKIFPISIFLFVRKFAQLSGLTYLNNDTANLIVNSVAAIVIVLISVFSLLNLLKRKHITISVFCLSSLLISYLSIFLFVKSVDISHIYGFKTNLLELSFIELIKANLNLIPHRYLMVAGFANSMIVLVFVFNLSDNYIQSVKVKHFIKILFLSLIFIGPLLTVKINLNGLKGQHEKISYWRLYNKLIFENPKLYYIPYNGFPEEKHCIKYGIDKIIDVNDFNGYELNINKLHPTANNWRIMQIVLENSQKDDYPNVMGMTKDGKKIKADLINGSFQPSKALVYYFDNLYTFETISVQYTDSIKKYHGIIRLVGQYE